MPNVQMLPPGNGKRPSVKVNGQTYSAQPGAVVLVPDFDAAGLEANGWLRSSPGSAGTTAQRPTAPKAGTHYLDTTIGAAVVWDGVAWRHHATGASA